MITATQLEAALDMGLSRKEMLTGIELEERYCRIAVERLSQDVLDFGGEK